MKKVMTALKKQFGFKLKQLRRDRCITQEQLADMASLSVEAISNIERGIFGPKFDNLEKLAQVLDIEVKTLFDF